MLKKIRSFVRREGRITPGQQKALEMLFARYAFDPTQKIPNIIEIGFGMGQSLLEMATQNPHLDYLGIEVHRPGVGALLAGIEKLGLTNIRVSSADAVDVLQKIPSASVDAVYLFFPDPWPKKRHNKRRIVQPDFMQRIWEILKTGGQFWMATDCDDYAQHAASVISSMPGFQSMPPTQRPLTKFEQRGQRLGHEIHDLVFIKTGGLTS